MAKEGKYAQVRLPSGETRLILMTCHATIGVVGNPEHENESYGKAGKSRWLGIRPHVRGVAMTPRDHPHGGGEAQSPIGRKKGPASPWGKPAIGAIELATTNLPTNSSCGEEGRSRREARSQKSEVRRGGSRSARFLLHSGSLLSADFSSDF